MLLPFAITGQTKKEVMFSLDTLYKSHLKLTDEYRKLVNNIKQYDAFYVHVKKAMLDKDLVNEPIGKGIALFDDVWQQQTGQLRILDDSLVFLLDSLNHLSEQFENCSTQSDLYLRLLNSRLYESAYPNTEAELIGSWQLFLNPMQLTGEAYNSGLISHNPFTVADSLQQYNIFQIDFLPDELATIHFKDGRTQKCFYKINEFSVGTPYNITCSKQDEFKMTLHISPMPSGLEVSYEIPLNTTQVLYFNGVMKPGVLAAQFSMGNEQAANHPCFQNHSLYNQDKQHGPYF
jgi:hypothetical protein